MNVTNEQDETSLGYILQQAREQRGLTLAQAATQLNLKVSVIAQMEAEQWDQSVAPTFMRGYLRSYARLLKLSETEILQAFAVQTAYLRHHPKEMKSFSNKTRRDAAENRFMLATYFVVVLLIGLFLVSVWQTHMLDEKPVSVLPEYNESADLPVTDIAIETTAPNAAQGLDSTAAAATPAESQPTNLAVSKLSATETAVTAASASANTELSATSNVNPATERTPITTLEPTVTSAPVEANKPAVIAAEPVAIETTTAANDNISAANEKTSAVERGQLTLQFSKGCWVSVEDNSGKRLTYQMYQAGQEAQISGAYPLKVTLGEPTAVTLQLNDVSIDLSQYQTGRVARLTFNGPV
jgi:cytoskeleton protein RodZ